MRDMLMMQITISKGIITNYDMEVIPDIQDSVKKELLIDTLEQFKNDLAAAEFFLSNGYDMDVMTKYYNDLKCYISVLRDITYK